VRNAGAMRTKRLKVDPRVESSVNHLVSRTNNGEWVFSRRENIKFLSLARQAAEFCGLDLLTFALMATHPHLFADNPVWKEDPSDAELLRRYRVLNPGREVKYRGMKLELIEMHLRENTEFGIEWRRRQIAQMGDISQFMKILKQRFTAWFNRVHRRTGTIWGGRFKNVLVEENSHALLAMAVYIDLNPIRAGIVRDPKNYVFSGYGQAIAGHAHARKGIQRIVEIPDWEEAQAEYRKLLFAVGTKLKEHAASISIEDFEKIVAQGGKISLTEALLCRIRRFTDGVAFGSAEFVEKHLAAFQMANNRKRLSQPKPMPPVTDWGGLCTLRGLRQQ
jgi:REP-associated tyrosine transposase